MNRATLTQQLTTLLTPNPLIQPADVKSCLQAVTDYATDYCPYVGDGQRLIDGATTSGSAVLTSARANFTSADVGKWIEVRNASSTGNGLLTTTIASVQSATSLTLAVAATKTATVSTYTYGTPMDNLIQPWLNQQLELKKSLRVVFRNGLYLFVGSPAQTVNGMAFNAHVYVPYSGYSQDDSASYRSLELLGETMANLEQQAIIQVATPLNGVTFYSNYFGAGAILGAAPGPASGQVFIPWNYTNLHLDGISFLTETAAGVGGPSANSMGGVDLSTLTQVQLGRVKATVTFPILNSSLPGPSVGIKTPAGNNHAQLMANLLYVSGYYTGVIMTEHFNAQSVVAVGCYQGITTSATYGNSILHYTAEDCVQNIGLTSNTALFIGLYETEKFKTAGPWYNFAFDVATDNTPVNCCLTIGARVSQNGDEFAISNPAVNVVLLGDKKGATRQLATQWTTTLRPTAPGPAQFGFNTTLGKLETWSGTAWV